MTTHQDTNTERNCRVQERYDELMQAGKHGHYESMFRVVREEVDAALSSRDEAAQQPQGQAGAAEVSDEQIQVAALQLMERHPEWVALKTLVPFGDELSPFSIGLVRAILALKATAGGVA